MGIWSHTPQYRLIVRQKGAEWSLQSAQATVVTAPDQVGTATFVVADYTGFIRETIKPRARNLVELWSNNRFGQTGRCWTGYINERGVSLDPQSGDNVTLRCTSPVALFEQTHQTPGLAATVALQYAANVTGSQILRLAAKASGYPSSMIHVHPLADSGSGYQNINGAVFTSPDLQPWAAVVSAIQRNSGIEWFFDEAGACIWRQVNFVEPWFPVGRNEPRTISADDILGADFMEGDEGVVTRVEVRYFANAGLTGDTAGHWTGPASMEKQLGVRQFVVYEPYILSKAQAAYVAEVLGLQYGAGAATASVLIPADPLITVGSLVQLPLIGTHDQAVYYVSSVHYMLEWGGGWNMLLTLAYGRSPTESFPYIGSAPFPVLGRLNAPTTLQGKVFEGAFDVTARTIIVDRTLDPNTAITTLYPPNSTIQVYVAGRGGGALIGASTSGEFTTSFGTKGFDDITITLSSNSIGGGQSATKGYVTLLAVGQAKPAYSADTTAPATTTSPIVDTAPSGQATDLQLARWAKAAGIPPDQQAISVAIAIAESGKVIAARNATSGAAGLWQILPSAHPTYDVARLLSDGPYNAQAMAAIYKDTLTRNGTQWTDWVTYTSGAYLGYMAEAKAAVAQATGNATTGAGPTPPDSTGGSPTGGTPPVSSGKPGSFAEMALETAFTLHKMPYSSGDAGPDRADCSGLVAFAFYSLGMGHLIAGTWATGQHSDVGPEGVYDFFLAHGATKCHPSEAVRGDLLFIADVPTQPAGSGLVFANSQRGFIHVGWCWGPNQNYGADGPTGAFPYVAATDTFHNGPYGFSRALRMGAVTLTGCMTG